MHLCTMYNASSKTKETINMKHGECLTKRCIKTKRIIAKKKAITLLTHRVKLVEIIASHKMNEHKKKRKTNNPSCVSLLFCKRESENKMKINENHKMKQNKKICIDNSNSSNYSNNKKPKFR